MRGQFRNCNNGSNHRHFLLSHAVSSLIWVSRSKLFRLQSNSPRRHDVLNDHSRFLHHDAIYHQLQHDQIATMQRHPAIRTDELTQLWTLWVTDAQTWALICQDGDYHILWAEGGSYTDFPVGHITFFVQHGCIMLTSEY